MGFVDVPEDYVEPEPRFERLKKYPEFFIEDNGNIYQGTIGRQSMLVIRADGFDVNADDSITLWPSDGTEVHLKLKRLLKESFPDLTVMDGDEEILEKI